MQMNGRGMRKGAASCSRGSHARVANGPAYTQQGSRRRALRHVTARAEGGDAKLNTDQFFDVGAIDGMIFDIDGTLLDSDPFHHQAFAELLPDTGFNGGEPISRDFYDNNISGGHTQTVVEDFFPDWSKQQQEEFSERKEERFRELAKGNLEPNAGLIEFLAAAKARGVKMAAVTNATPKNVEAMLDAIGAAEYFPDPLYGNEVENQKPAPDPYEHALDSLELAGKKVVAFEDSPTGAKSAKRAGCNVMGIATTHPHGDLKDAGADYVIDDFTALLA